jgi:hypothetical protein
MTPAYIKGLAPTPTGKAVLCRSVNLPPSIGAPISNLQPLSPATVKSIA